MLLYASIGKTTSGQIYVTDFPEEEFLKNDRILMLPHLGGSTREAFGGQRTFGS